MPSGVPSSVPSGQPTSVPSGQPTLAPSAEPSSEPTLSPTYSSTAVFQYQQDLVGIFADEFSSRPSCSEVFRATVAAVRGASTEASGLNITRVTSVPANFADQSRLLYSMSIDYVGSHDLFLQLANFENSNFIARVESGNFTSELQRLAVEAGETLLYNVTSSSVLILDFDHLYKSLSPTMTPYQSPGGKVFYEQPWFTLAAMLLCICAVATLVFALGFYWRAGTRVVHTQLRKVFVRPKVGGFDSDSSSGSDSDGDEGWL